MKIQKLMLVGLATALALMAVSARAEITIATIGPMTGPFEIFGEQVRRGTHQAVADLNAKGGVLGQKVKMVVGDDRCDPKKAVAVAKDMLNQGVSFIAGHFCSGASIAASDVYNAEGILQISPASTNPALTERGYDNVYRVCGRDDRQGTIAGDYLAETFGGKRIAIVHDGRSYSKALAGAAKARLNSLGMNEDLFASVKPGKKNYDDFVAKLLQNKIDALYYGGYHREAGLIVRRMREQGMSTTMISGDDLATQEYWKITGAAGEGSLMTYPLDPRKAPNAKSVVATFRKAGFEPEGLTLHAYAAVQIWALAAAKAGSMELDKLTKALNSNTFKSVLGEIAFDGNGDVKQPAYVLYKWSGGKYVVR